MATRGAPQNISVRHGVRDLVSQTVAYRSTSACDVAYLVLCGNPWRSEIRHRVAWRTLFKWDNPQRCAIRQSVTFRIGVRVLRDIIVYVSRTNLVFKWIARKSINDRTESAQNSTVFGAIRQLTVLESYGGTRILKRVILLDFDCMSLF